MINFAFSHGHKLPIDAQDIIRQHMAAATKRQKPMQNQKRKTYANPLTVADRSFASQADLARYIGLNKSSVRNMVENGRMDDLERMVREVGV